MLRADYTVYQLNSMKRHARSCCCFFYLKRMILLLPNQQSLRLGQLRFFNIRNEVVKTIHEVYQYLSDSTIQVFRKAEWQLEGDKLIFFFGRCMSSVFVNQVLSSDDHRSCESQKCEKLLSFCTIFVIIFFSSCVLYQCCPECHDLLS